MGDGNGSITDPLALAVVLGLLLLAMVLMVFTTGGR